MQCFAEQAILNSGLGWAYIARLTSLKKLRCVKGSLVTVGIVGLGLMGGSLGLELQELDRVEKVLGYDHNLTHCEDALRLGLVDEIGNIEELHRCDIIILAIPVDAIITVMQTLVDVPSDTVIIDLGSTKYDIIQNTPSAIRHNLVAAHPMTGTEKSGPQAAFKGLFRDKVVVLCDLEHSGEAQKTLAISIFEELGMKIVYMNAFEHDVHASFISHMPHVISYAIANSVMGQEDPKSILALAAGGFRDMSRLAKSSPTMWGDIFKQNRENLLQAIDMFQGELDAAKKMIKAEDDDALMEWMKSATTLHKIL
jgi:prephenate dehydrogenase